MIEKPDAEFLVWKSIYRNSNIRRKHSGTFGLLAHEKQKKGRLVTPLVVSIAYVEEGT